MIQTPPTREAYVDRIGTIASAACALHCGVCALLPAAFTVLGLGFLLGHEAEWALTGFAVSFGLIAFVVGWRRHRKMLVFAMLAIGIVGLLAARLAEGQGHHHGHGEHAGHASHAKHAELGAGAGAIGHSDDHDEPKDHHEGEHHDEAKEASHGHGPGEGLGVVAGLILMMGHITNLREIRRAKDAACSEAFCDVEEA